MLIHRDTYEGMPPRLYRHPDEVRADISKIRAEAKEIEEMLSVRELLMEFAVNAAGEQPEVWIPKLCSIADEADEALDTLLVLRGTLKELRDELGDLKWLMTV